MPSVLCEQGGAATASAVALQLVTVVEEAGRQRADGS